MSVDFVDTGTDTGSTAKQPPFTGEWQVDSADARTALARIWAVVLAYEERQRSDAAMRGTRRRRRASAAQMRFETALQEAINHLKSHHAPIAEFLPSEMGYQVQRIESNIVVETLLTLHTKAITALPIHDSLVVRHDWADEARAVMERVFEGHTGVTAVVRSKSS